MMIEDLQKHAQTLEICLVALGKEVYALKKRVAIIEKKAALKTKSHKISKKVNRELPEYGIYPPKLRAF